MAYVKFFEDGEKFTWEHADYISTGIKGVFSNDLGVEYYDVIYTRLELHCCEDGTLIGKYHIACQLGERLFKHYVACVVDRDFDSDIEVYYLEL